MLKEVHGHLEMTFYGPLMTHQNSISFNFTMISEGLKEKVNSWVIHLDLWDDAE